MTRTTGLTPADIRLMVGVFSRYPQVTKAVLYGSRAKGNARPNSDVDLALYGDVDDLTVEQIALDLDELPLPYLFDVQAVERINHVPLLEHIHRVGVPLYPQTMPI